LNFFLQGTVTKLNVRSLPLRMDKFLLINPLDGGTGRKKIEETLIKSSGIYPNLLPTFDNPLSDFLKKHIITPMCHYLVTEMKIDRKKNNRSLTQFFKETCMEDNPYFEKGSEEPKKVKFWRVTAFLETWRQVLQL